MHWIDPDHLPQTVGNVVQFTQNPKGESDGDPHLRPPGPIADRGLRVAKVIAVGDKVHVRGVRPSRRARDCRGLAWKE